MNHTLLAIPTVARLRTMNDPSLPGSVLLSRDMLRWAEQRLGEVRDEDPIYALQLEAAIAIAKIRPAIALQPKGGITDGTA